MILNFSVDGLRNFFVSGRVVAYVRHNDIVILFITAVFDVIEFVSDSGEPFTASTGRCDGLGHW